MFQSEQQESLFTVSKHSSNQFPSKTTDIMFSNQFPSKNTDIMFMDQSIYRAPQREHLANYDTSNSMAHHSCPQDLCTPEETIKDFLRRKEARDRAL